MDSHFGGWSPYKATGYRMIRSASIQNFRCFEKVTLSNCRRLNVIVGQNGSGKTALLEALFLACGPSPEVAFRFKGWRGFEATLSGAQWEIEDAIWLDLFHRFGRDKPISVNLVGSDLHNRMLTVSYESAGQLIPLETSLRTSIPIKFEWKRHDGYIATSRPKFTKEGIQVDVSEPAPFEAMFFTAGHIYSMQEGAKRYSIISKTGATPKTSSILCSMYPFIKTIAIEIHVNTAVLHASVAGINRKIPLNLISSGVTKMASILLGVEANQKSVICIDEIENGFHYKMLPDLWKHLLDLAIENDVQLFVSTHSRECLDALAASCSPKAKQISLIRAERSNGVALLRQFQGVSALAAIKSGEVR